MDHSQQGDEKSSHHLPFDQSHHLAAAEQAATPGACIVVVDENTAATTRNHDHAQAPLSKPKRVLNVAFTQILGALAAIASGTARPLMTLVFGALVNNFNSLGSPAALKSLIDSQVLFFVYLFVGQWVLVCSYGLLFSISAMRFTTKLRASYLRAAISQDFGRVSQGKAATDFSVSVSSIEDALSEKLGIVLQAVSTVVTSLIIALTRSWRLTLVMSTTIAVLLCSNFGTAALDSRIERRIQEVDGQAASLAEECLTGIQVVTSCVAQSRMVGKYARHLEAAKIQGLRKSPILAAQYSISYFVVLSAYALGFWYGTQLLERGEINDGGSIVIVILCINQGTNALRQILPVYGVLAKARAASQSLAQVIASKPIIDPLSPEGLVLSRIEGRIELRDVAFAYPSRPAIKVLDGMTLCFDAGKSTALIGPSGSGKSTIVGLLERWYNPSHGTIKLDGHSLDTLNVRSLRSNIGLVQQDATLFNDSIFYNVASGLYGTPLQELAECEKRSLVEKCCVEAQAHTFIQELPQGYDTKVGDRGSHLSGGQKQRIAIARAIMSSPRILIFDEATSALDSKSERLVEAAMESVSRARTTITISHKVSAIKRADRILVLRNGRVIEEGNHESLLNTNGTYAHLHEAQDLRFSDEAEEKMPSELTETEKRPEQPNVYADGQRPTATRSASNGSHNNMTGQQKLSLIMCLYSIFKEHRPLRQLFATSLLACLIAGAVYPGQAIVFGHIVTVYQLSSSIIVQYIGFWSLMFFVIALGALCAFVVLGTLSSIAGTVTARHYREEYFSAMMQQSISFHDDERNLSGLLLARLSSHTSYLQGLMTVLSTLMVTVVNLGASSILALIIAWKVALVALFGSLPVIVFAGFLRVRTQSRKSNSLSEPLMESAQYAAEVIGAARTVAALTMETEVCERLNQKMRESLPLFYNNILITMPLFAFSQSGNLLGMALTFWYGGHLVADRDINAMQLWIIFLAVVAGGEAAGEFFANSNSISHAQNACNSIFDLRSQAQSRSKSSERAQHEMSSASISLDNIHFSYPTSPQRPVLQGVTVTIPQGQKIAIVGPSGSGKSTIIALLERFYDPSSGEIRIGNTPLAALDVVTYRSTVSLVSQETLLFQGTLRENILLGVADAEATDERLEAAARDANIHDFIMSLSDGYSTTCGSKGMNFSGGQRQRIALARALVRKPSILLLDEATSALDSDSEMIVQDALKKAARGRTTVTVAHRLSTVMGADRILVLVRGRVQEEGTHAELMRRGGVYWAMCRAQSLD